MQFSCKSCAPLLALTVSFISCCLQAQNPYDPVILKFEHLFGGRTNLGLFDASPTAIDQLGDGRYVVLAGTSIFICDSSFDCTAFGSLGTDPGEFGRDMSGTHASDLAVDSRDHIVVADTANWRIQVCDEYGYCTVFGREGETWPNFDQLGTFFNPRRVRIDSLDRIWVGSDAYHRVQICDAQGLCSAYGEPLQICDGQECTESSVYNDSTYMPGGLALAHVDHLGRVFLVGERILVCDQSDIPKCIEFKSAGGDDLGNLVTTRIDSDENGLIFLADAERGRIHNCNINTGLCRSTGSKGDGPGQFEGLGDIHAGPNEFVSTVEYATGRVQLFSKQHHSEFSINAGLSDAWYNRETDGQGFFINVYQDQGIVFLSWFTFETTHRDQSAPEAIVGERYHRWLTAQGPFEGKVANLDVLMTSGGIFMDSKKVINTEPGEYGTITIEFHDCWNATLSYELHVANEAGEIPIIRVAPDNARICEIMDFQ